MGVHPPERLDLLRLEGVDDVRRPGGHAGGEAVGAGHDLARLKIEDNAQNPTYINTVWGYGYKWGF